MVTPSAARCDSDFNVNINQMVPNYYYLLLFTSRDYWRFYSFRNYIKIQAFIVLTHMIWHIFSIDLNIMGQGPLLSS